MKAAYETVLIDIGLGGDIVYIDCKNLHKLAEKCYFQHLWGLCDFLEVKVSLDKCHNVQLIRVGERCFMGAVVDTGCFTGKRAPRHRNMQQI